MRPRHAIPALTLLAVLPLAGCTSTSSSATTEERLSYLRQVARQGAETGTLLRDQDAPRIDKARCTRAFEGVMRREDYPADTDSGGVSKEWEAQIKEFFVDSCVSGRPKAASERSGTTTTTTDPTTTTTDSETTTEATTTTTTTDGTTTDGTTTDESGTTTTTTTTP